MSAAALSNNSTYRMMFSNEDAGICLLNSTAAGITSFQNLTRAASILFELDFVFTA